MKKKIILSTMFSLFLLGNSGISTMAHGYISGNGDDELKSRIQNYSSTLAGCPQCAGELDVNTYDFTKGQRDGLIANSGGASSAKKYEGINAPGTDYTKNEVNAGQTYKMNWYYTAAHSTLNTKYYITKDGWNPNDGLQWSDFEPTPIQTIEYAGAAADSKPVHDVTIPASKSGYHVIAYNWNVTSPTTQWVSVVDLNVSNNGVKNPTNPTTQSTKAKSPFGLHSMETKQTSVTLMWNMASQFENYDSTYDVYVNGTKKQTVDTPSYKVTGLTPNTQYTFKVVDTKTNAEATYTVTTAPKNGTITFKGIEDTTVNLNGSFDPNTGVSAVDDDGDNLEFSVKGKVDTTKEGTYTLTYTAKSGRREVSSTRNVSVIDPQKVKSGRSWNSTPGTQYVKGEIIQHEGNTYEVIQDFTANGDPNWINASSLFKVSTSNTNPNSTPDQNQTLTAPKTDNARSWDSTPGTQYVKGEIVQHEGTSYEVIQDFSANGDSNWINAPSLFKAIS